MTLSYTYFFFLVHQKENVHGNFHILPEKIHILKMRYFPEVEASLDVENFPDKDDTYCEMTVAQSEAKLDEGSYPFLISLMQFGHEKAAHAKEV